MSAAGLPVADGNSFAIIGRCTLAARKAGWSADDLLAFTTEATAGDYDHLLQTVIRYFDEASGVGD